MSDCKRLQKTLALLPLLFIALKAMISSGRLAILFFARFRQQPEFKNKL
jgi:hypothetical protein